MFWINSFCVCLCPSYKTWTNQSPNKITNLNYTMIPAQQQRPPKHPFNPKQPKRTTSRCVCVTKTRIHPNLSQTFILNATASIINRLTQQKFQSNPMILLIPSSPAAAAAAGDSWLPLAVPFVSSVRYLPNSSNIASSMGSGVSRSPDRPPLCGPGIPGAGLPSPNDGMLRFDVPSFGSTRAKKGLNAGMQLHMTPMLISIVLHRSLAWDGGGGIGDGRWERRASR